MRISKNLQVAGIIVLMVGGTYYWLTHPANSNKSTNGSETPRPTIAVTEPGKLAGVLLDSAPWGANSEQLKQRLDQIGLPALAEEALTMHTHQHLDLWIEGKKIDVPSDIGVNEKEGFISIIHTHDKSGIIHVESPVVTDFYLGQVFDVWGVRFDSGCIGGHCAEGEKKLDVYVDGKKVDSDIREVKLDQKQEIAVVYGTADQLPKEIPDKFDFPAEY